MTPLWSRDAAAHLCAGALGAALSLGAAVHATAAETIVEIRIHGNYSIPDAEVVALAGVAVGDVVEPEWLDAVDRRLTGSGRFEAVEAHKRYRSLTATDRVALVIVVRERPRARFAGRLMFLPILRYEEGYGVSYGMHFSLVDVPGSGGRFSVPVTWGGDRRTAFEVESPLGDGELGRLRGGGSSGRRVHPHFELEDRRLRVWGGFNRHLFLGVHADVEAAWEEVVFGERAHRLRRVVVGLEYDSLSSNFPRDDVKLRGALERLSGDGYPTAIFRPHVDVHAFKGMGGQVVLAARVLYEGASAALQPYEQSLLGGVGTLRGWRFGARVGDRMLATSVELRLPMNSPFAAGKTGFRLFYDTGAVWNVGAVRGPLLEGVGIGVFLSIPILGTVQFDVGHDLRGGVVVHSTAGFGF